MVKNFVWSLIFVLFFAGISFAKLLTIDQSVNYAVLSNPEILSAKNDLDAVKAKVPQTISLADPSIGLEYEQIPSGSRNLEDGMKMYTAKQMVMFPGKIYADYLTAANESAMFEARYKGKIFEISNKVKSTYYDLFYIDRSIDTLVDVNSILLSIKKAAIARYTSGDVAQTDALMANIEYLETNNDLKNMRQERFAKEAALKSLLDQTDNTSIETSATLNLPDAISQEEEIRKTSLDQRPELLEMKAAVAAKDSQSLRSVMEYFPDLDLGAKKRVNDGWDAMISFTVPLYFWKQGYGVSSSGSEKNALEAAYKNMKNMTVSDIKEAYIMANSALQTAKLYEKEIIPQSMNAYKISLSAYKAGKTDFTIVLQAEKKYREAKLKYYENRVKYGKAIAELEKLCGVSMQ